MTYGAQILIKPLKIKSIPAKRELVGVTDVILRKNSKLQKAFIYKSVDNAFDTQGELYRVVIGKRKVIGYTLLTFENNEMHLPLLGSLDLNYKVGKILSGIAIKRFLESDYKQLHLTSSWNSLLHHKATGFKILPQKEINGKKIDKIIASKNMEQISKIGCIVMYLPDEKISEYLKNPPILNVNKLFKLKGEVGSFENFVVYKKTHSKKYEEYQILKDKKVIGKIYLNYYINQRGYYCNYYGEIPEWSPFYKYGKEEGINKIFAEYWSIDGMNQYDNVKLIHSLVQIALEAGKYRNCAKLQIEADWDEHIDVYNCGFRTQDIKLVKDYAQIKSIIAEEEKNPKTSNLNKIGSIDMVLSREDAIKYGWNTHNI